MPPDQSRSEGTPSLSEGPYVRAETFWLLLGRLPKVTRRKGGTPRSRYRSNGYTPTSQEHPITAHKKKCPNLSTRAFSIQINLHKKPQCETAPLAPNPVCERTNCGKNAARSFSAATDLSVIEKNQIPINAMIIENNAGYS